MKQFMHVFEFTVWVTVIGLNLLAAVVNAWACVVGHAPLNGAVAALNVLCVFYGVYRILAHDA